MLFATPVIGVDVSNLVCRASTQRAYKGLAYKGKLTGHIYGFLRMVISFAKAHPGAEWWWAVDGHSDRQQIDPNYKANRGHHMHPLVQEVVDDILPCLPGVVWAHPDYEADDLLAQMARSTADRGITLFTNDKDLWTCLRLHHVSVWNCLDVVDNAVVLAGYGVPPAQIVMHKAIYGDHSDCVKSACTRILERDLNAILCKHDIRTLAQLEAALPQIEEAKRVRLQKAWPLIARNYRLVCPRSRPDPTVTRTESARDPSSLRDVLERTGCKSLLRDLDGIWRLFALPKSP